jgi:hypothetical protein
VDRFAHGAFADVFSPAPGGLALKLFRRHSASSLFAGVAPYVFAAETQAYERAVAHELLRHHVPAYHGPVRVDGVLGEAEEDLSSKYWLNLCYATDRLAPDPRERKLGSLHRTKTWRKIEPLVRAFEAEGIMHTGDASVLHWRTRRPMVIDFATSDAAAWHSGGGGR